MQQKRNHHTRIERRLAEPTHIAAHDRLEIQALPHQPNDKPRDVVLGHEVPHIFVASTVDAVSLSDAKWNGSRKNGPIFHPAIPFLPVPRSSVTTCAARIGAVDPTTIGRLLLRTMTDPLHRFPPPWTVVQG